MSPTEVSNNTDISQVCTVVVSVGGRLSDANAQNIGITGDLL